MQSCQRFQGNNMKKQKYSNEEIMLIANRYGNKSVPKFICIDPEYERINRQRYVRLKCLDSGELKSVKFSNLKDFNPFSKGTSMNSIITESLNALGKKATPQYICINPQVKTSRKKRIVRIKCLKTNKSINVLHHSLIEGKNPFNESLNRVEVVSVQPKYERLFKKYKIDYVKEFKLNDKSIIDFKFKIKNKVSLLEVKQSGRFNSAKNQLSRYRKLAKQKKMGIFFSDPQGKHQKHGFVSIREFESLLLKNLRR